MKKRLLITSVVMMLVIALSLSTATYAWFTSNANVQATTITLTANSSDGTALGIGWLGGNAGTIITANGASIYNPMVPSELDVDTTDFDDVTWSGATTYVDEGVDKFNTPYSPAPSPYQYNGDLDEDTVYIFYIENLSQANTISTVTMTLSNVDDASDLLRVAVFTSSTSDGTYTLKAVFGKEEDMNTEWGVISAKGDVVADLCDDGDEIPTVTSLAISNLAPQGKVYFKVVAWLDGVALNDTTAQSTTTLGLSFQAE